MSRSVEITGESIVYLFYAVSLAFVPVVLYFVLWPLDDVASIVGGGLLAALVLAGLADFWNWKRSSLREHLESVSKRDLPYDITYDPYADPWAMAVQHLSSGEDVEEG